ncbi:MAG TPA: tRNA guanosine(34) transglycosylase Tgt [Terriglobales bacterium]
MKFQVTHRDPDTRARAGLLSTPHGAVETPVFMPVGTAGTVKAMAQEDLERLGVQILLGNTYHLYLRPGHEVVRELGGLHHFMGWSGAVLTDSGGYQIMSLERLGKVSEDGYDFRSHLDGSRHLLSPEGAVEIQAALGSDIMMALDHCVEYPASHEVTAKAMRLTNRWARRCRAAYADVRDQGAKPALFGIVQGGIDAELRRESAEQLVEIGFEGYALGGLSVGEPKSATYDTADHTAGLLPPDRPRYLMGVGTPEDVVECVARGIDMFDCVMPTRHARNGAIFTSAGRIVIKNAHYARDPLPLDPACRCDVCRRYSRGYLRHLFLAGEMLGPMLATRHNLHFYLDTMREIRDAIRSGAYNSYRSRFKLRPEAGEAPDS